MQGTQTQGTLAPTRASNQARAVDTRWGGDGGKKTLTQASVHLSSVYLNRKRGTQAINHWFLLLSLSFIFAGVGEMERSKYLQCIYDTWLNDCGRTVRTRIKK